MKHFRDVRENFGIRTIIFLTMNKPRALLISIQWRLDFRISLFSGIFPRFFRDTNVGQRVKRLGAFISEIDNCFFSNFSQSL